MKKPLVLLALFAFPIISAKPIRATASVNPTASKVKDPETQMCYGRTVHTESLHEAQMGTVNADIYRVFANSWFRRYDLTISVDEGWHFVGNPVVHFVGGDRGAFNWNCFDVAHDRVFVSQKNPNYIVVTCWAGSKEMDINLACMAVKDGGPSDSKVKAEMDRAAADKAAADKAAAERDAAFKASEGNHGGGR